MSTNHGLVSDRAFWALSAYFQSKHWKENMPVFNRQSDMSFPQPGNPTLRSFRRTKDGYVTTGVDRARPQPYLMRWSRSDMAVIGDVNFWGDAPNQDTAGFVRQLGNENSAALYAKAYSKFVDSVGTSAQIGAALGEGREAIHMIANRASQMRRAYQALRRGHFGSFASELNLSRTGKKYKSRPSQAAGLWLEYHFGWEPLVKDVYDACQILQGQKRLSKAVGKAGGQFTFTSGSPSEGTGSYRPPYQFIKYSDSYRLQSEVEMTNPNLGLASKMGLINPLSVAWELVPFSFVPDWFLPVGNFLDNLTNLAGFVQKNSFYTRRRHATGLDRVGYYYDPSTLIGAIRLDAAFSLQRVVGELPLPRLAFKLYNGTSVTRGATEISLLISAFSKDLVNPISGRRVKP